MVKTKHKQNKRARTTATTTSHTETHEHTPAKKKTTTHKGRASAILDRTSTQTIIVILLVLTTIFVAVHYRSYSYELTVTDEWIQNSIENNIRNQVAQNIPALLEPTARAQRIERETQQILKEREEEIQNSTRQQGAIIREQLQNDDGHTYLIAIDPYYYYYLTRNYVDHGYGADAIIDGVKTNTLRRAPLGTPLVKDELHTVFSAYVYKAVRLFSPNTPLLNVFFWIPVIIIALAVIPAFFIAKRKTGPLGGLVAGILVAIHPSILGRTPAGFSDTDGYIVLFSLLSMWLFMLALDEKKLKQKIVYIALTGLSFGLFTLAWLGWWLFFLFTLFTCVAYIAFILIKEYVREQDAKRVLAKTIAQQGFFKGRVGQTIITVLGVIVSSVVFVTLFSGFRNVYAFIGGATSGVGLQSSLGIGLWPNVLRTVAELNVPSVSAIITQVSMGQKVFFVLMMMSIIFLLIPYGRLAVKDWSVIVGSALLYIMMITDKFLALNPVMYVVLLALPVAITGILMLFDKRELDVKYALLLIAWVLGTIYASTQGVRFILLMAPALCVSIGLLIGNLHKRVQAWSENWEFSQSKILVTGVFSIIAISLLIAPLITAHDQAKGQVPSMNDAWWNSLEKIKEESAPDAIINSWWDFGHWFIAIAERGATFDGGMQSSPMAHWMGRALVTSDENESIGILRMLNCGGSTGFDKLAEHLGIPNTTNMSPEHFLRTKALLDTTLVLSPTDAREELVKNGLSDREATDVLSLTHCNPPEGYLITSGDMVGKSGVWGHFGLWDFERAHIYANLRGVPADAAINEITRLMNMSREEARTLHTQAVMLRNDNEANSWISPWPGYITRTLQRCEQQNTTLICPVNVNVGQEQGRVIRLEYAVVELQAPSTSYLALGAYDASSGARVGGSEDNRPAGVVIGEEELVRYEVVNPTVGFDVVVWKNNDVYYSLVTAPELSRSTFTKLFYLEGSYTENFEKFSDAYSQINGDRILIWNMTWNTQ